uniref:SGNH hydrolase-type esterase domain-containing protein n=1 Tax=Alexandrium catenella TaxID=2925 RepID=A0A7S1L2M7_ALECA|mmetsp:Transcript_105214/g.280091  ORF Transcript_105214/g.280091 Transcript_105214/m.280091 type:complete len:237 (+) Transcript_105214:50-760(+)
MGPPVLTVACIGDSLTKSGYPEELHGILDEASGDVQWRVLNLGVNGATAAVPKGQPGIGYIYREEFQEALASSANIAAILLGTNDAHQAYWDEQCFIDGLTSLVHRILASRQPPPEVLLMVPPPLCHNDHQLSCRLQKPVVNGVLPRLIPKLARDLGVGVVDVFSAFGGQGRRQLRPNAYLADGCHLARAGRRQLAEVVAAAVLRAAGAALERTECEGSDGEEDYCDSGKCMCMLQ